jgi:putative membrane protein
MKASRVRMLAVAVGLGCGLHACLWGLALPAAGQMGGSTPVEMQPGGDRNWAGTKPGSGPVFDKSFLKKAIEANLGDVEMGRLTLEKSTDNEVRHYAIQETDDHGKILDELKQAAQQLTMSVPDGPSKSALKEMEKLKALSGDAFDQAFLKETAKNHKDEDKSDRDEARTTTSPQLKDLVTQENTIIGNHLKQAQQLAQAKGKK